MKRKLFFFLEKLQISKSERIAVSVLMILVIILAGFYLIWSPQPHYSEAEYAELEKIFEEKSRQLNQEREVIMARYEPMESEAEEYKPEVRTEEVLNDTIPPAKNETESRANGNLIDINSASAAELQELPGIGPAYSKRIIEWRKENGEFTTADQLLEIKGIGEKRLANIKPLIKL